MPKILRFRLRVPVWKRIGGCDKNEPEIHAPGGFGNFVFPTAKCLRNSGMAARVESVAGSDGIPPRPVFPKRGFGAILRMGGQVTRMVTSIFRAFADGLNKSLRYCFILTVVMPVFAASPSASAPAHATSVVVVDTKTGKLARSLVVKPRSAASVDPHELKTMVDRVAVEQGVEVPLVHSVIRAESNYNPDAVSPRGAIGLMQLIPATAKRFGVSDVFDPRENIEGGVRYLRFLLDYYQGDYAKAIAAYNAGEGAVDRSNGIPPYTETREYVRRVAQNLKVAREKQPPSPVPVSAGAAAAKSETYRPIQASTGSDGLIYYRTP